MVSSGTSPLSKKKKNMSMSGRERVSGKSIICTEAKTYGHGSKPCTPGEHQNRLFTWVFHPLKDLEAQVPTAIHGSPLGPVSPPPWRGPCTGRWPPPAHRALDQVESTRPARFSAARTGGKTRGKTPREGRCRDKGFLRSNGMESLGVLPLKTLSLKFK